MQYKNFKFLRFIFVCALSFLLASCEDNPANVAGELIGSFENTCSSSGRWSKSARAQTQKLITVFESLKNKDQCQKFGDILDSLHRTATGIHNVYEEKSFLGYQQKKEELQELALLLSSTSDVDLQGVLQEEILNRQIDLASLRAEKNVYSEDRIGYNDAYSKSTAELSSKFSELFSHQGDLAACLQQSPGSAVSLFSALTSVAGSFVSPVLGANLKAVSGIMTSLMQYGRKARIESAKWDLYEAQMPQALTCGLESMTNFYCQAEDGLEILETELKSYPDEGQVPANFWRGIDILVNRLPIANNWLQRVRNGGVDPQARKDAGTVVRVLEKRLILDARDLVVKGILNEFIRKIENSNSEAIKVEFLVEAIVDITNNIFRNGNNGPFVTYESSQFNFACKLLKGPDHVCPVQADTDTLKTYIQNNKLEVGASLEVTKTEHWVAILDIVTQKVNVEFNEAIQDAKIILGDAHEPTGNQISPRAAFQMILDFLVDFKNDSYGKNPHLENTLDETIMMISDTIADLDNFDSEDNPLINIFDRFELFKNGTEFFSSRISFFIEADLMDRLESGDLPENIEEIIRSAKLEAQQSLGAAGQEKQAVLSDLQQAMRLTRDNYRVFRGFMLKQIGKAVENLHEGSVELGETLEDGPFRRTYGQGLAHLCVLVYATGDDWPSTKAESICKESVLQGARKSKGQYVNIHLNQLMQTHAAIPSKIKRNKARVCSYYNFLRKQRLLEILPSKQFEPRQREFNFQQYFLDFSK